MHQTRARILSIAVVASTMIATYALSSPRGAPLVPSPGEDDITISYPSGSDAITAMPGQSGSAFANVSGPTGDTLTRATLTGTADVALFSFVAISPCNVPDPHTCVPSNPPQSIDTTITLICTPPPDNLIHTAQLNVTSNGPMGVHNGSVIVRCEGNGTPPDAGIDGGNGPKINATLDNNGSFVGAQGQSTATSLHITPTGDTLRSATITGDSAPYKFNTTAICGPPSTSCAPGAQPLPIGLEIDCTPTDSGVPHMAQLVVQGNNDADGSDSITLDMTCQGTGGGSGMIQILSPPNPILVPVGSAGETDANISASGNDILLSATITDGGSGTEAALFAFDDTHCFGQRSCSFADQPALGAYDLRIICHPPDTGQHFALLTVTGVMGGGDTATASLSCQGSDDGSGSGVTGPTISTGADIDITTSVGSTGEGATIVSNSAIDGDPLLVTARIATGSDLFAAEDCDGNPCSLMQGQGSSVRVRFTPLVWGVQHATLELDSNDHQHPAVTVVVTGHGSGGELEVAPGSDREIAIGPIPLGQLGSATFTVTDDGNIPLPTDVRGVDPPFGIPAQLAPMPSQPAPLTVTCQSSAPTNGVLHGVIQLSAPAAYKGAMQTRFVSCEVADTNIRVDPTSFDFGEVREGAPMQTKTLTISNPTASPVTIHAVGLTRAPKGLAIAAVPADTVLAPTSGSLTVALALSTDDETDLNDPRTAVAIDVVEAGGHASHLELLVTGSVVVASSTVTPDPLDLGTACIGHAVSADAVFTNTGTATLHLQPPSLDTAAFTLALAEPAMYPAGGATIASHGTARATLAPASTAAGTYTGTLTWSDDVPSTHAVPISVAYKSDGTAISPLGLAFGTVEIGISSAPGLVRLENCGGDETQITVGDVVATSGSPTAWSVASPGGRQKLSGHGAVVVPVSFVPNYPGQYTASLQLVVDGKDTAVTLSGFAEGTSIRKTFYGCGCDTDGSPGGWPIAALGALWLSGRRRRGSSSAR